MQNYPKVCWKCNHPHIGGEQDEVVSEDGTRVWHKCHDSNVVELPVREDERLPTVEEVMQTEGVEKEEALSTLDKFKAYLHSLKENN